MMRKIAILTSVFGAVCGYYNFSFAGGVPASNDEVEEEFSVPVDLNDQTLIDAGKETFHSTCADYCHGHEPVLFLGRGDDLEPYYVYDTIFHGGRGATPMPPWGEVFSKEEIWELVSYIKYLGTQE